MSSTVCKVVGNSMRSLLSKTISTLTQSCGLVLLFCAHFHVHAALTETVSSSFTCPARSSYNNFFYDVKQSNGYHVSHVHEGDQHETKNVDGVTNMDPQSAKEALSLPRIDPIKVGFTRQIRVNDRNFTMTTLSLQPPIFEIPEFLTDDECELIINMTDVTGLAVSKTVWQQYDDVIDDVTDEIGLYAVFQKLDTDGNDQLDHYELAAGIQGIKDVFMGKEDIEGMFKSFHLDYFDDGQISLSEFGKITKPETFEQIESYLTSLESTKSQVKSRNSFSAFIDPASNPDQEKFFEELYQRISKVTQLPIEMIRASEALQILKYEVGGHYHAHHDSEDIQYAPCCHLMRDNDEGTCRPCRYATMFYYLNEPTEGGATAFPFADNKTYDNQKTNREEKHRLDLSEFCDQANLVYKPKKGTVLLWYNHVVDDVTGWVGDLDMMTFHGGCDVIKGVKWAANNWLNAQIHREKDWELWREFQDPLSGEESP